MREAVSMLLLALVCSNASAEWVLVANTERASHYFDPNIVRGNSGMVRIWDLTAVKTAIEEIPGKSIWSSKTQREYDCKEERTRILYGSLHTGKMGEGETVNTDPEPKGWVQVIPGSATETMWKIACGKL